MPTQVKLNNLSEIYSYFRKWDLPVFFVHPTPYNVLGLGQWVRSFKYISHFDSFDGHHHRVTVPRFPGDRTFTSKEDIVNYLLSHPDTHQLIQSLGGHGKMLTVMFDEQTEQLAKEAGLEIALPPAELRMRLDSKIVTTQLADEAACPPCPMHWVGPAATPSCNSSAGRITWAMTWWCKPPTGIPGKRRFSSIARKVGIDAHKR